MKKSDIKKYIKKAVKAEFDKLVASGDLVELKDVAPAKKPKAAAKKATKAKAKSKSKK